MLKMETDFIRVQFDDIEQQEDFTYIGHRFVVTLLTISDEFIVGYNAKEHTTYSYFMLNQKVGEDKTDNTSAVSGLETSIVYGEIHKFDYLIKSMCKALIEFM